MRTVGQLVTSEFKRALMVYPLIAVSSGLMGIGVMASVGTSTHQQTTLPERPASPKASEAPAIFAPPTATDVASTALVASLKTIGVPGVCVSQSPMSIAAQSVSVCTVFMPTPSSAVILPPAASATTTSR